VRLYLARGETAAAHRQLQECQRLLASELGVELSAETLALLSVRGTDEPPPAPDNPNAPVTVESMLETFRRSQQATVESRQRLDAELEDLRRNGESEARRERVVGPMPTAVAQHFKNRKAELETLDAALARPTTRLIVVCGRNGLGKTALVTRWLHDLLAGETAPEAVVYVAFRQSEYVSLGQIVELICRTIEPAEADDLRQYWARTPTLPERLEFLFHRILGTRQTLMVFDAIELILDEDNRLSEEYHELRAFIENCVEWDHGVRLVATSRRSVILSPDLEGRAFERRAEIELGTGLPEEEAIDLLRELDGDGSLGIRDADEALLRQVVRACHGVPRTLETLAGTLRQRRTMTLPSLLENDEAFHRLTDNPARELYEILSTEERLVMQGLAILGRPVTATAVRFLLPGLDVDEVLDALVRNYAASFDAGRFSLHRMMQDFVYRQLPHRGDPYSRTSLHARAADFYRALHKPRAEWKSIADVDTALREFQHLVKSEQYDKAGTLVNLLDADYLSLWGYPALVIDMRNQLSGRLTEAELASQNWGRLGVALRDTGDVSESISYLQQALDLARQQRDVQAVGVWLTSLGLAHGRLGHWRQAVEHAREALDIGRARRIRSLEARALGLLGHGYRHLGRLDEALDVYRQAVRITQELGDRRRQGVWENVLSHVWLGLGKPEAALEACERALVLATEVGHRPGQGAALGTRGRILVYQGKFQEALVALQEALAIAREVGLAAPLADTLETLGYAHHQLGETSQALACYDEVLAQEGPVSYSAMVRRGLADVDGRAWLDKGTALCRQLLRETPDAFRRLYTLALGELALGEARTALATYQQALEVSAEAGIRHEALQNLLLVERRGTDVVAVRTLLSNGAKKKK
jgi:tetratricopeptide (TPR) repeat protein